MKFLLNEYVLKAVTLLFWYAAGYVFWVGHDGWFAWLPELALYVLGLHAVEALGFWLVWRGKSRWPKLDCAQVLVFGVFHLRQFWKKAPVTQTLA